ncbi:MULTISPECIES: hypothetical protein [Actinosynnema]|uniref:hypothetical protein n=1 Tax=Actinosynnema TaxID=40566 RepID=UPI0020A511C1|nr:hypothetical protein [Actinosynnema pretiosum]MCP2094886.1 hypothetical protein [Actinosynnema pretiosum]
MFVSTLLERGVWELAHDDAVLFTVKDGVGHLPEPALDVPRLKALAAQLTNMDGGVLVDAQGNCHAIGVILDGAANGRGSAARGSRCNNAIRYLGGSPRPAVVVVADPLMNDSYWK